VSKEEEGTTSRQYLAEVVGDDYRIAVRCLDWSDAVAQVCVGRIKARIAALAGHGVGYEFKSGRWLLVIPKNVGQVKERIALALLSSFPNRLSQTYLLVISSVQPKSLRIYLKSPKLGVKPHIDVDKDGVLLNKTGLAWALQVLQSLEKTG
jgi:hypothetical protein